MVSKDEEMDAKTEEKMEWDADMEIQLFYAMVNHKPVGVSKHFQMLSISHKLANSIAKDVTIKDIWEHLETMYNLKLLDDAEPPSFPNAATPFSLPEHDFGALMKKKLKEADEQVDSKQYEEVPEVCSSSPKASTPRSSSRGTKDKGRKDSTSGLLMATKTRKESGSSHASTDTPSNKSEKDYDPRRDSRDSNASGPRESTSRKSISQKDRRSKAWDSIIAEDETTNRRGRRRTNTPTTLPSITPPATRRRT